MQPLARLRLKLTAWYAGVFLLVLALLGVGLFLTVRYQMSRHLDASLRAAGAALERAARIRETERASAHGAVVDAVDELHIPDRSLHLLDGDFQPIKPAQIPDSVRAAAREAVQSNRGFRNLASRGGPKLRLYAEPFRGPNRTPDRAGAGALQVGHEHEIPTHGQSLLTPPLAAPTSRPHPRASKHPS